MKERLNEQVLTNILDFTIFLCSLKYRTRQILIRYNSVELDVELHLLPNILN